MRTDPQTPAPSKRPSRVRRLTNRVRASRRRTRVATGTAVVAMLFALRPQPAPAPGPVPLGKGQAGVFTAETAPPAAPDAAMPLVPAEEPVAGEPAAEEAAGQPIKGGEASYYGEELAGNPTASGEPFRPEAMTAAHRTLPLGSRIRVTNLRTDESVIVRVNDRGPFAEDRVLDLSKAAAREIGMLKRGTAKIRMELLPKRTTARG